MPKVVRAFFCLALWALSSSCSESKQPVAFGGFSAFRSVHAETSATAPSPSGRHVLSFIASGPDSTISIDDSANVASVTAPASYLWGPSEELILINDGEGSGMTSRVRLVEHASNGWREIPLYEHLRDLYFIQSRCPINDVLPDAWGLGFVSDDVLVLMQAAVHANCRPAADFFVVRYDPRSQKSKQILLASDARIRYRSMLPPGY